MEFRNSVPLTDFTAADGTKDVDLNTEPTSHLMLVLKCLNLTANTKATLAQILGALESFEVLHKGSSVMSLSGADLYAISTILLKHEPWQLNEINLIAAVRAVGLIIPFGRKLYDPKECFPATAKGDLVCKMKVDIADTGYDGLILHLEQVMLPGATPERYLKFTEKVITQTATGEKDIDLPRGNQYAGIMFYGATVPVNAAWTCTLENFSLKVDESEKYFQETYWEALHFSMMNRLGPPLAWCESTHMTEKATAYTQNEDSDPAERVASDLEHYAYMDFDPRGNDDFLINTGELSSLKVRPNFGDTGVARCIPIELKKVA